MKNYFLVYLFFIFVLVGCASNTIVKRVCIGLGEEWEYDTREGEERSRVIIVDSFLDKNMEVIYVVRVSGVSIDSPYFVNYYPDGVPYLLITEEGLTRSLKEKVGKSEWNPTYDRYYIKWRNDNTGKGISNGTIKYQIFQLEQVLNTRIGS